MIDGASESVFKKSKRGLVTDSSVLQDRVRAITSATPPQEYTALGKADDRPPRKRVFRHAVLRLQHGEEVPVILKDLNVQGCRVEYVKRIWPVGNVLLIEPSIPIRVTAEVVWLLEGTCGLRFEVDAKTRVAIERAMS